MLARNIILLFFAFGLVGGCKSSKKAAGDQPASSGPQILEDEGFRKPTINRELYASTTEVVPLDTAFISRDTLHLLTKPVKACETENFKLMWNGALMKSLPPQANLRLFQLTETDCKESHPVHLKFNITPLRYKSPVDAVHQDSLWSRVTVVRVGGWKNALRYQY